MANHHQQPTTTSTTQLKTPGTTPLPSRDASPQRVTKAVPVLRPPDDESIRPHPPSVIGSPTRPSAVNSPQISRPISLQDASSRALQSQNSDRLDPPHNQWPVSPRLKSPSSSRQSSIILKQSSEANASDLENTPRASRVVTTKASDQATRGMAQPADGPTGVGLGKSSRPFANIAATLETVEEGDNLTAPRDAQRTNPSKPPARKESSSDWSYSSEPRTTEGPIDLNISSDLSSRKTLERNKTPTTHAPGDLSANQAAHKRTATASSKGRAPNEQSASSMTVETETVPSIPQASGTTSSNDKSNQGKRDDNGSLRTRPSNETIRPKKERKKVMQKRSSVVSGAASTKADIFEAKILSAAEDDSDSEETFVYESNPPDQRTTKRHHSRTPSGTSMRSAPERRSMGRAQTLIESHRAIKNKRSMKFASNAYGGGSDGDGDDNNEDGHGTIRLHRGRPSPLNDPHYHNASNIWGAGGTGSGDRTPVGDESPFSAASKARNAAARAATRSSRNSPNLSPPPYTRKSPQAQRWDGSRAHWDQDHGGETQPLIGSLRAQRTRPLRRPHSSNLRHIEYYEDPTRHWARRCSVLMASLVFLGLLIMSAGTLLYITMKPLYDVSILEVQNVLASEEALMVDINCIATNPNLFSVQVTEGDLNFFARSQYVGTDSYWRRHGAAEPVPGHQNKKGPTRMPSIDDEDMHISETVDEGTDPMDDPAHDSQTMLLGRIFKFDNALMFEASPLSRSPQNSTAELRLEKPGNKTEAGGSERWEKVIQHQFQLIVRGILKYKLPYGNKIVHASISKSITVDPLDTVPREVDWHWSP